MKTSNYNDLAKRRAALEKRLYRNSWDSAARKKLEQERLELLLGADL